MTERASAPAVNASPTADDIDDQIPQRAMPGMDMRSLSEQGDSDVQPAAPGTEKK